MPTARHPSRNSPIPVESREQQDFAFPENAHLLITTPRHIFAWDQSGIHEVFRSKRGGIVAAREAKDGSGVLAVASSNVVVMHDTKHGKEESWGLTCNAPEEEVRHLEFSPDAKSLFLSTTSDGAVQHYSTDRQRLLDPTQRHDAAPVALAVSPTGHLILSASHNPPVVFLKNLQHNNSQPLHIQPQASSVPVSCAAFHPERPNVFLLAFRDGTVAAYDATKMPRSNHGIYSNQQSVNDGEILSIQKLHRATMGDSRGPPVAGAAFLPGYKTRAVTAGRDGKCRLVDFSRDGEILRTWHAKAPLTSVAVCALKPKTEASTAGTNNTGHRRKRSSGSHTIGGPTSTSCVIAVSRVDGKVYIYDSVGLLLAEKTISGIEEKILSVDWLKGPSPRALSTHGVQRHFSDANPASVYELTSKRISSSPARMKTSDAIRRQSVGTKAQPGLPEDLKIRAPSRKFTVHPDEALEGTVRYTPSPSRNQAAVPAVDQHNDLFSPANPRESPATPAKQRISSPPRNRPRISSQTFVQNAQPEKSSPARMSMSNGLKLSRNAGKSAMASDCVPHRLDKVSSLKPSRPTSNQVSPSDRARRHITFQHGGDASTRSSKSTSDHFMGTNAIIFADSRTPRKDSNGKHGALSLYATSPRQTSMIIGRGVTNTSGRSRSPARVHVHDPSTWPTDSGSFDESDDDFWMTSDSEGTATHDRRRTMENGQRPPARQSSRSLITSIGTMSTAAIQAPDPSSTHSSRLVIDGVSDDDRFMTAQSYLSPVSHMSEDVRDLFPRGSSLQSPERKSCKKTSTKGSPQSKQAEKALTELAVNTTMGSPRPKSPWDKVKASRSHRSLPQTKTKPELVKIYEEAHANQAVATPYTRESCPETIARMRALEGEVAQLKGEVLAMKTAMRRNGLTLPACLR